MRRLVLLAAGFWVLLAVPAGAHTAVTCDPRCDWPYQRWVDQARVPTPNVSLLVIQVADKPCDSAEALACYSEGVIELSSELMASGRGRAGFLHEVGHAWDQYNMQEWQRERFSALIGKAGQEWSYEDPNPPLRVGTEAPAEWFAESYSLCARLPSIHPREQFSLPVEAAVISGRVLRRACWIIGRRRF